MPDIVLTSLNARWSHANMGLRCLRAQLGELRQRSVICEFTIHESPQRIVEALLAEEPRVIGMGVYIWNLRESEAVLAILKSLRPDIVLVCGGPELSYGSAHSKLDSLADCIVSGEGEVVFAQLCRALLNGTLPPSRISAPPPELDQLVLPYDEYDQQDLEQRIVYVEASRGCPFSCEFCLSAQEGSLRHFDLTRFLAAMQGLIDRGCRNFKFVDRSFNVHPEICQRILRFFWERWPRLPDQSLAPAAVPGSAAEGSCRGFFLHFEFVPRPLSAIIAAELAAFPARAIHCEIGIQTMSPAVGSQISRRIHRQDIAGLLQSLKALPAVQTHTDLIVGLPGESLESFLDGYDQLQSYRPDVIDVGILKLLHGTPLHRHIDAYEMVFNPDPPYDLLQSRDFPFALMRRLKRFARYHDLFVNSGSFSHTLALFPAWTDSPARSFLAFSDWLWQHARQEHQISLTRKNQMLFDYLVVSACDPQEAAEALCRDAEQRGDKRGLPEHLRRLFESRQC